MGSPSASRFFRTQNLHLATVPLFRPHPSVANNVGARSAAGLSLRGFHFGGGQNGSTGAENTSESAGAVAVSVTTRQRYYIKKSRPMSSNCSSPGISSENGPVQPTKAFPMGSLPSEEFYKLVDNLDAIMFDCDGVLWLGMNPMQGAQELVIKLRALKKKVFFLTNNSTKTREEFLEKFNGLGFQATMDEIVGTAYLAALYLKERNFKGKAYVIGTSGITGELEKVGIESLPVGPDVIPSDMKTWVSSALEAPKLDSEVKAVVVGFDHHISYAKLYKAATYLANPECLFVATNTDERFPSGKDFVLPGTGSIVNAVITASEREPAVMGKPNTYAFELIKRTHDLTPDRVLMVGDRANTDIYFGKNCGLKTLLVLSGVTTLSEMRKWQSSANPSDKNLVPDFYLKDVNEFFVLLEKYHAH